MKRLIIPEKNLLLQEKIKLPQIPKAPFPIKKTICGIILILAAISTLIFTEAKDDYADSVIDKTHCIVFGYIKNNDYKSKYRIDIRRDRKLFLPYIETIFNFNDFFYKDCMEIKFETNIFSEQTKNEISNKLKYMWKSVRIEINDSDHTPNALQVNIFLEGIRYDIL